jgi:predicted RNA-binding protein with PUA-like domain
VSSIVGLALVLSPGRPDPKNPKSAVVDLEFLLQLDSPVPLAEVKQTKMFDDWALVRQGRLSTMLVPEKFVTWIRGKYPKAGI